jgi:phosphotransferase system enzyme I (PtsP)
MLKILRRIIEEISDAKDFHQALQVLAERVKEVLQTGSCSIFLLDYQHGEYVLMATAGLNQEAIGKVRIDISDGLIGQVGLREEPINLEDATVHEGYKIVPNLGEENFKAFLAAPIIYQRRLIGVIVLQQKDQRTFDEEEEAFLVTIATQLAGQLARAEILEAVASVDTSRVRDEAVILGTPASPGVAIGQAVVVYPPANLDNVPDRLVENVEQELENFNSALASVRHDIEVMRERFVATLAPAEQILFDAYLNILNSNSLAGKVRELIQQGSWAQAALRDVIKQRLRQFEDMEDAYLRERATDIKDLGQRILAHLQSQQPQKLEWFDNTVLIADELTASDLAAIPENKLAALVSVKGSSNSHVAVLARALGVPAIMGADNIPLNKLEHKTVIVDGYYGQFYVSPSAELKQEFTYLAAQEQELAEHLETMHDQPAETIDGKRVIMQVNIGLESDLSKPLQVGAEGVGLYRSEVPFLSRDRFPSEEEQRAIYRQLLNAFAPNTVTMRTLDIGGDKVLSYFPIKETNPFLGWRGIRVTLDQPDIFLVQIRAMLRASEGLNNLRIMLPMISCVSEFDEAYSLILQAYSELLDEQLKIVKPSVGVMIEVPSAIYQARTLARRADFLSIGSNDLTQYLLAVDRNNTKVSSLFDSLHPAVINAIRQVVRAAHLEGKLVSVCGEMAGDPLAAVLLLAIGVDIMSMNTNNISRIKWVIRRFSYQRAKQLLTDVIQMESPIEVRSHLELALERAGLGGLIRAGKY